MGACFVLSLRSMVPTRASYMELGVDLERSRACWVWRVVLSAGRFRDLWGSRVKNCTCLSLRGTRII